MSGPTHEPSTDERSDPADLADLRDRFLFLGRVAWRETKLTAIATWSQLHRLFAYVRANWKTHRLERKRLAATAALGERLDACQLGDSKLRARLADLQERRQSFVAAKESTRAIDAECRGLHVRLAEPFLEAVEAPIGAEREHRQALALQVEVADRLDRQTERRTNLFPFDLSARIRVAVGLGLCALLVLLILSGFRGERGVGGLLLPPQVDLESLQPLASFPMPSSTELNDSADGDQIETREFELAADAILPARTVKATFINGLPEGEVRSVDAEGRLISIERFRRGRLNGPRQRFYPDGQQLFSELRFMDGVASGKERIWFADGSKASDTDIVDGLPHGESLIYFQNGRKCVRATYVNGQLHGQRLHYRPDDTCFAIINWRDGAAVEQQFLQIEVTESDEEAIRERGGFSTRLIDHWK